jgi:hypothetical protein
MSSNCLAVLRTRFMAAASVPVVAVALCVGGIPARAADAINAAADAPFLTENRR